MKLIYRILFCVAIWSYVSDCNAQNCQLTGQVIDSSTDEALPLSNIIYKSGGETTADINGKFDLSLPYGKYSIEFSFVGYVSKIVTVDLNKSTKNLNVALVTKELQEALIEADMAIERETPVAFSNIDIRTINEELASQDIPMILNSTPGVYATQSGGGDGDARITIRGFSQRNVAVMLDGVPVNDMENGWVYWSNWFGLDAIMQTTQVQRGLGVSRIAVPSVGGTINIITKGIEQKKATRIKQEVANNGFFRTTIGHTSGRLKGGWGVTLAGSYKQGNGWVDGNWTNGYFYYGKVQKSIGNHILTLTGFGAPQSHGQRSYKEGIHIYDQDYANDLGVNTDGFPDFGLNYNIHNGTLVRYDLDGNNQRINEEKENLNERKNYYHKPQFSFKHSWSNQKKLSISTVAYLSLGNGGGTGLANGSDLNVDGSPDFQTTYDLQSGFTPFESDIPGVEDPIIIPAISTTERKAHYNQLNTNVNNHFWYGILSSFRYKLSDKINLSGGVDARHYKGEHYREVYDLLGADYYLDKSSPNQASGVRRVGDIIDFHNDNYVEWGGLFGQVEYKTTLWSAFFSASYAMTRYKRVDKMMAKSITIDGVVIAPSYEWPDNAVIPELGSITAPNGVVYTPESEGLEYQETDWFNKGGFTFKTGVNRKLNEFQNVFMNVGYLDLAPKFNNIYYRSNDLLTNIENEKVQSIELGYGYKKQAVSVNFNSYLTVWKNRPFNGGVLIEDPQDPFNVFRVNINGMNARHLGGEVEMAWAVNRKLTLEGVVSVGDWIWNSADTVLVFDRNNAPVPSPDNPNEQYSVSFDAKGVHVGNAAQTQLGGLIRYEIDRGIYAKLRYTFFDRYFADFNPTVLNGDDAGRESWRVPGYGLVDFHMGQRIKFENKMSLNIRASVLNILNTVYISDADDSFTLARYNNYSNDSAQGFDAGSAGVFFGQGTRFNVSATLNF